MVVCQQYEKLHTSERFKEELIAKINHIENRNYFQKKFRQLKFQHLELTDSSANLKPREVEFKMDLDQLKQKITKSAEMAEHYFQERVATKVEPKLSKHVGEENKASDPAILF